MLKSFLKVFVRGILAGAAIGLGGLLFTVCLGLGHKIIGSIAFSIGLLLVCSLALYLYTGKVGMIVQAQNKKLGVLELLIGYIGNFIGAVAFGYLIRLMFLSNTSMLDTIKGIASTRMVDLGEGGTPIYSTFISSIFCGMLVFIAVYAWKKEWNIGLRVFVLVFAVFAFVVAGFEHCIANMFYISFANMWQLETIINIATVTIGNSIGAILLSLCVKYLTK